MRRGRRWLISGTVQGVGFRWFTHRVAGRFGVSGWVRNLPDGRVEVVGQGTSGALDSLEEALREGPAAAYVQDVEKSDVSDEVGPTNMFEIR